MKKFMFILFAVLVQTGYAQYDQKLLDPGTGTGVQNIWPMNIYWGYTRSATIYYASDINHTGGEIREMLFHYQGTMPSDSIPLKIYMMPTIQTHFPGAWSWDALMGQPTLINVFDGKVKHIAGSSVMKIRLTTPLPYNGTDNLCIVWETNYGGTGVATAPTYSNKDIDHLSRRHLVWVSDNTPPAGTVNGSSIEFISGLALHIYNPGPNPVTNQNAFGKCGKDSVKWSNNASNDSIIVVASYGNEIPYLFNGYPYAVGSPISTVIWPKDTVVFRGKSSEFVRPVSHTELVQRTYYIWHYTPGYTGKYSAFKSKMIWGAKQGLYSENFNSSLNLPNGWSASGNVSVLSNHGHTGNGLAVLLNSSSSVALIMSSVFCGLDENSHFRFKYRYVNQTDYPSTGTAPANIGSLTVTFATQTGTVEYVIADTNHVQSTSFATITLPVGHVADNQHAGYSFYALRGTGSYFLDLDDIEVYTTTGVSEEYVSPFTMYPNPVEDILTFETTLNKEYKITIMNLSGQIVKTIENINTSIYNVDVSALPSGMYIVNIQSGKESKTSKFVKQ